MKPTIELKNEHKAIKSILNILERICNKLESGEKVEPKYLEEIIEFVRVFADKCHHGKEEDLLFPEMQKISICSGHGCNPIEVMLEEHKIGRKFITNLENAVRKYKKGDEKADTEIIKNARGYVELLRTHIDKEDNVLYPIVDETLSTDQQKKLEIAFERVEKEIIGEGRHEKFHKLIEKLKKKFT